jgi:hypothetical protein
VKHGLTLNLQILVPSWEQPYILIMRYYIQNEYFLTNHFISMSILAFSELHLLKSLVWIFENRTFFSFFASSMTNF